MNHLTMSSCASSETGRLSEIFVKDVSFPELAPNIQCISTCQEAKVKDYEQRVFDYLNIARMRPSFIAATLKDSLNEENDKIIFKGNACAYKNKIKEALNELEVTLPLAPLKYSAELSAICREVLESSDSFEDDPKAVSGVYRQLMVSEGYDGIEKAKILYIGKNVAPEHVIFDLIINGSSGELQRHKLYNSNYNEAGVSVRMNENSVEVFFICYRE